MRRLQETMARVLMCQTENLPHESLPLRDYADWDSLRHVALVVGLESDFQVKLSAEEIRMMTSAAEISRVLRGKGISD